MWPCADLGAGSGRGKFAEGLQEKAVGREGEVLKCMSQVMCAGPVIQKTSVTVPGYE